MIDLDQELNPEQADAVRHVGGPLLVLAGAGSGKTRVITYKIAHLVQELGFAPWQILAVTFTNKAAAEMRERTARLLGAEAKEVWLGTFHSIGLRVLRRHHDLVERTRDFVIYDEDDKERLLSRVMKQLGISTDAVPVRAVSSWIDHQKHKLHGPNDPKLPVISYTDSLSSRIYTAYEKAKQVADAFDFSDLIFQLVKLLERVEPVLSELRYRWRYMLVDEFQDTDHAQYRLLKLLAGDTANLCVVGDDDQSIYRWRGAHVQNILGFPKDFGERDVKVVRLERNYRSTANILRAASTLIANNTKRHDKTLWTDHPPGEKLKLYQAETETGEARWVVRQLLARHREGVSLREMAIFYRAHSQSRVFEDALRAEGTAYVVVGGLKFYERKEVKDILGYLRFVQNPRDEVALLRIIDAPPRGIGATTLDRARALADRSGVALWEGLLGLVHEPEGSRARRPIEAFAAQVKRLRAVADAEGDVLKVAEAVLAETGYLKRLQEEGTDEAETRAENIGELMVSIGDWRLRAEEKTLSAFLDHVSLLTSLDEADVKTDALTLMTVHAAKGLEFDSVFITGLEEHVFPHFNAKAVEEIEEERRLAYVAITRGRRRVTLSFARSRQRFGRLDMNPPSRFLREVPAELLVHESEMGQSRGAGGFGAAPRPSGLSGGWAHNAAPPPTERKDPRTGRTFDYSESQVAAQCGGDSMLGRTVRHPSFGDGRVARIEGTGPKARVTVQFPAFGTKTIIAQFLDFNEE